MEENNDIIVNASSIPIDLTNRMVPNAYLPVLSPDIKKKKERKPPKPKILPMDLENTEDNSNQAYKSALQSKTLTFSPIALGFLPTSYWSIHDVSFNELVTKFFQRKNTSNCRFPHKLFNALRIVQNDPKLYNLFGVKWVTKYIFLVDKLIFGRLLGLNSIDGGLFHSQGNFPSHGFIEVFDQIQTDIPVDHDRIRILKHKNGLFSQASPEEDITNCKWGKIDYENHQTF